MSYLPVAFSACILGAAAFVGAVSSTATYAQSVPATPVQVQGAAPAADAEKAAEPYVVDEKYFNIEAGKNAAYYQEAEKALRDEMNKFIASKPETDVLLPVYAKANATLQEIARLRLEAPDIDAPTLASAIRMYGQTLVSQKKSEEIAALIAKYENTDEQIVQDALEVLKGFDRFANLVGNDVLLEGLFLDGKELDWASYRGKVVLIDFWATWCGPCRGEIPNMKAMYEKYHDAGFEIVGYSVDQDLEALEKFEEESKLPWDTLSRKMSLECKDKKYTNMSAYYGVTGIPTMILVDKDGKAIDTNARGQHLTELLEKIFPEVK